MPWKNFKPWVWHIQITTGFQRWWQADCGFKARISQSKNPSSKKAPNFIIIWLSIKRKKFLLWQWFKDRPVWNGVWRSSLKILIFQILNWIYSIIIKIDYKKNPFNNTRTNTVRSFLFQWTDRPPKAERVEQFSHVYHKAEWPY